MYNSLLRIFELKQVRSCWTSTWSLLQLRKNNLVTTKTNLYSYTLLSDFLKGNLISEAFSPESKNSQISQKYIKKNNSRTKVIFSSETQQSIFIWMVLILILYKAKGMILCINVNKVIVKRKVIVDVWASLLSVQFSRLVVSNYFWPHGLQHTRPPWPSSTPEACSNSCPSSRWCHPTISSPAVPFSSCLQFFPTSGSFPMSHFFASGGESIRASAS